MLKEWNQNISPEQVSSFVRYIMPYIGNMPLADLKSITTPFMQYYSQHRSGIIDEIVKAKKTPVPLRVARVLGNTPRENIYDEFVQTLTKYQGAEAVSAMGAYLMPVIVDRLCYGDTELFDRIKQQPDWKNWKATITINRKNHQLGWMETWAQTVSAQRDFALRSLDKLLAEGFELNNPSPGPDNRPSHVVEILSNRAHQTKEYWEKGKYLKILEDVLDRGGDWHGFENYGACKEIIRKRPDYIRELLENVAQPYAQQARPPSKPSM